VLPVGLRAFTAGRRGSRIVTIDLVGALLELWALGFLIHGLDSSCFPGTGFGPGLSCGTAWLFVFVGLVLAFIGIAIPILEPSEVA
jgi:hypothetical protein